MWLVDYIATISGESVVPSVLPTLSAATLMASFPTPSVGGAYMVLAIDVSSVMVFDMSYNLTTTQFIRSSEYSSFETVLVKSFKASSIGERLLFSLYMYPSQDDNLVESFK